MKFVAVNSSKAAVLDMVTANENKHGLLSWKSMTSEKIPSHWGYTTDSATGKIFSQTEMNCSIVTFDL